MVRWGVCLLGVLFSMEARADFKLEAVYKPDLKMSGRLVLMRVGSQAVVSFIVKRDGSVSEVEVLSADDPELGKHAAHEAELRRYKPWAGSDNPQQVKVSLRMVIVYDRDARDAALRTVSTLRCEQFSQAVAQFRKKAPSKPLNQMDLYTDTLLATRVTFDDLPYGEMVLWEGILSDHFATVVDQCKATPTAAYLSYLPQAFKDRLATAEPRPSVALAGE